MDEEGMDRWDSILSISSLHADYEAGTTPTSVISAIYERIEVYKDVQPSLWIHLQPLETVLEAAKDLVTRFPKPNPRLPLWGVPFSVKDNIDIAGILTTCGCPALAYTPEVSAPVYQKCVDAGAIFIGKTNMEQLATGMTGCRSPYGTLHSTWSKEHAVGGSSSGSAVSVSAGLVSFSLGSDTAGSIRVPALFNGIVGFKPTKGTISARGVVPACKHQDTIGLLTTNVEDAEAVWRATKGFDKDDPFAKRDFVIKPASKKRSRICFGIPPDRALETCSAQVRRSFGRAIEVIQDKDRKLIDMDWTPFRAANELLYSRSFVVERLTIFPEGWFEENKQSLHHVTRQVFEGVSARNTTALDVFRDLHTQEECKRIVENILPFEEREDEIVLRVMIVPTTPFHPMIQEAEKDPIAIDGKLGTFAHFANVLDLVGIALPAGSYLAPGMDSKEPSRLPFGVTVLAKAGLEEELMKLAKDLEHVFHDLYEEERD